MTPDDNFKLPPPPKNIFVTQIQEDLHSSYDKLRQHPIVKQNAASLVKNSSNTQQSTLLLQREQELSDTDAQHREAIDRYNAKNKELTRRENALKDKREKFEERKLKFASYIKDEKSRQQNALNKIELVTNDINDKVKEISELEKERDVLRDEHFELVKKNTELQKYKILLEKAVESMPDGYIEIVGDSPADSLILKYNTLKDTQTHLQERLQDLTEQVCTLYILTYLHLFTLSNLSDEISVTDFGRY
ncbi:Coiled-coil domain-containing protein 42-like [Oopsacas minuta]|uniref:Coiled-coil domain-containing protein 42-like n=1 Tax=Oopsacas minuta TaxID=111878 RepID=A0AAV7KDN6_9METZ|nr:Coiled-coil domain-containing protein 42-like [Oopsacas minuta]